MRVSWCGVFLMPAYDYECPCGEVAERILPIGRRLDPQTCPACGAQMAKLVTTRYAVVGDIKPHWDENLASEPIYVQSKQHRQKLMQEHGVTEKFGKGWW